MKRSSKISLVLVASVSAVALAGCEPATDTTPAQPDLQVTSAVYANVTECVDAKAKEATPAGQAPTQAVKDLAKEACLTAEKTAKTNFANTAPSYSSRAACEEQYGPAACAPRSNYSGNSNDSNVFMPLMVGYMLGSMNNSTPLYYGAGSWRDRDHDRPIYAGGYNSRPVGYQNYKSSNYQAPAYQANRSYKSDLKTSTSMTPPSSLRGGFGSSFKASPVKAPIAPHVPTSSAAFKASTYSGGSSSYRSSGGYSSGSKASFGSSSRGGFGSSAHFSSGG